ncbi:DinB family protein [Flavobacterium algicola]|uniref:DinB family protein n=1 Tax=Flavobacterium algicola TaxID=556529 RepID=UPI001EFD51AB|nr:DinB family protein [Flavobacterium algicola]MCG9792925.1 DinB family protein [Flavobacterium algicola]
MQSKQFIEIHLEYTLQVLKKAEKLKYSDLNTLTWRKCETSWNILECLEHLNLYGNFYLQQMETKINDSKTRPELEFTSGILGSYFAKSMLPQKKINKIKTFKSKDPINVNLNTSVIDTFINQQIKLLQLLECSRHVSLKKIKIETSISSLIKINLGDTFQFFINHIIRHFIQIERIQSMIIIH